MHAPIERHIFKINVGDSRGVEVVRRKEVEVILDVQVVMIEGRPYYAPSAIAEAVDSVGVQLEREGSVPLVVDQFRSLAWAFRDCAAQAESIPQ